MKVVIDQAVLMHALERGAVAAQSDEAQSDTSAFSPLIKSVKLTVDDKSLIVESTTSQIASRYETEIGKENGVVVKEKGTVLIPATEFIKWVTTQTKAQIALSIHLLAAPQIINMAGDSEHNTDVGAVKKIGSLKMVSKDESGTGSKWLLDCYDSAPLPMVKFDAKPAVAITIPAPQLVEALRNVLSSSQTKDYQHVYDSLVVESYKGDIHLAASDTHRCSVYKLDQASNVDKTFFTETRSEGGKIVFGQKILVPAVHLKLISKLSDPANGISLHYDKSKSKVYVSQKGWEVRLAIVEESLFAKFPSIHLLLGKPFSRLGSVKKGTLVSRLRSASLVNDSSVLFDFKDGSVVIHAITDGGLAPNVSNAPVHELSKNVKAVVSVKHFMDLVKAIKDDDLNFFVPDDMRSVKVISTEEPNLSFYTMTIDQPKYAKLMRK